MSDHVERDVVPPPPPAAATLFGERLPIARAYAELLATEGVLRGLIGPREAPRIWERHVLNSAAVASLVPNGSFVVDVGSGAGLPGIVLAVARPDVAITLVESLARRTAFLSEAIERLQLERVTVVRARAEECVGKLASADIVTARAVAPLDRLAALALPLLRVGGRMLAIKGSTAPEEIVKYGSEVTSRGGGTPLIRLCGVGLLEPPVTVVEVVRERPGTPGRARRAGRDRRSH